ncbi:MAG: tetratricopeptide repeat protein, partial [FCB group bacterium]|nr:tetratricopeptide repeat protein [FCB group bacterium]
ELIASGRASYKTYNDQGWLYLYLSRPEEALASFKTSVEMDTSAVISQVFLANALRETGEFTASLDILNKLLALKMDTYTNNIKCWTLYKMDKAEEAVTCYNSTIEFEPDHPEAYYRLGWIFWEMEKWELAAEYYDLCDEISSGYKSTKWYQNSLKILIHNRD